MKISNIPLTRQPYQAATLSLEGERGNQKFDVVALCAFAVGICLNYFLCRSPRFLSDLCVSAVKSHSAIQKRYPCASVSI